jgi:hypothetical protein
MAATWELPANTSREHKTTTLSNAPGQWIKTAWNNTSSDSSVKEFKKCCVSNNMNGTVVWEEDHEENSSSTVKVWVATS